MYVHNGFTIEIYEFTHSLRTSLARAAHDASAAAWWRSRSIEDNIRSRASPGVQKTINCSTKGWKTTRYRFKKQLARQHLSDLLRSLTCEQDSQRTAHCLDSASSFVVASDRTFHMVRLRHMMHMHIHVPSCYYCEVVLHIQWCVEWVECWVCSIHCCAWRVGIVVGWLQLHCYWIWQVWYKRCGGMTSVCSMLGCECCCAWQIHFVFTRRLWKEQYWQCEAWIVLWDSQ